VGREMTEDVRERDMKTIYQVFITPEERRQRALLAGKMRGLYTVSDIAKAMGCNWSTVNAILNRENASIRSLMRLALALGTTMDYLTVRKLGKGEDSE
jgi:transcriptional regulator with XRE-family HTH domain